VMRIDFNGHSTLPCHPVTGACPTLSSTSGDIVAITSRLYKANLPSPMNYLPRVGDLAQETDWVSAPRQHDVVTTTRRVIMTVPAMTGGAGFSSRQIEVALSWLPSASGVMRHAYSTAMHSKPGMELRGSLKGSTGGYSFAAQAPLASMANGAEVAQQQTDAKHFCPVAIGLSRSSRVSSITENLMLLRAYHQKPGTSIQEAGSHEGYAYITPTPPPPPLMVSPRFVIGIPKHSSPKPL